MDPYNGIKINSGSRVNSATGKKAKCYIATVDGQEIVSFSNTSQQIIKMIDARLKGKPRG